jgi:SAM-dependent methyltransferase
MQNHSNVSDSPSFDRGAVAEALYLERGAGEASHRHDVNSRLGDFDLLEALVRLLELTPGKTVFDVGCGTGQHLTRFNDCVLPGGQARGFDISAEAVSCARSRGVVADIADAAKLPVSDRVADALSANFCIYYHPRLTDVLDEWGRVLTRGGNLVISGPAQGTNQELYRFHRDVTGDDPSDADLMAVGYVEGPVARAVAERGFAEVHVQISTNRVRFPDSQSFLAYWKATSLFARSPNARYEDGEARLAALPGPYVISKRVAILSARKS